MLLCCRRHQRPGQGDPEPAGGQHRGRHPDRCRHQPRQLWGPAAGLCRACSRRQHSHLHCLRPLCRCALAFGLLSVSASHHRLALQSASADDGPQAAAGSCRSYLRPKLCSRPLIITHLHEAVPSLTQAMLCRKPLKGSARPYRLGYG